MLFISPPFGKYLDFNSDNVLSINGSYTLHHRPGLLEQIVKTLRYSFLHDGWVNKIGLRNQGIERAVEQWNSNKNQVISIAITDPTEIDPLLKKIPQDMNIELNVSCPNIENHDNKLNNLCLSEFINPERKWCIIKLAPTCSEQDMDDYYSQGFRQFHCCNTYPVALGGLSGPVLIPFVTEKIKYIKKKYKDCEVIAGGGIDNIKILDYYKGLGADHFSVSSLCFNPFRFGWFYFNYLAGGVGAPHAP